MSTKKILRWARETTTGSVNAKVVLLTLAAHANSDGEVSHGPRGERGLSAATIARETEISLRSVRRALQVLETAGLIKVGSTKRDNGSWASSTYLLISDASVDVEGWCQGVITPSVPQSLVSDSHYRQGDTSVTGSPGLTSENSGGGVTQTLGSVRESPLEVKEKELKELAAARYARDAHARAREAPTNGNGTRRSAREQLERLAATAVGKDAYVLVTEWRVKHAIQLPQDFYDQVTKAVQRLLDDPDINAEPALLRQALAKLDHRPDAGLGLLRGFYTDMVRARNDQLSRPAFDEQGRPQRPLGDIPDAALTPHIIELIVGADSWTIPPPPREQDPNDIDAHLAWCRQAAAEHLADRRAQARAELRRRHDTSGA